MRFHKFISVILHPIVIPTIGVMLYFLMIPKNLVINQKLTILSLVFIVTYLIPLLILVVLKKLKIVKSYNAESIKERKLPIALMVTLFYLLGSSLNNITNFKDLGILFYATSLGLFLIYLLFYLKIKASIHLFSLGITTGFFLVLSNAYSLSFIIIIITTILFAGVLGSARLHLKAHNPKEVYIGFFTGVLAVFILQYLS